MARRVTTTDDNPTKALQAIPNVGPRIAADLRRLGINEVDDLAGKDPNELYQRLCAMDGVRHDPCVGDTFAAAVSYANGGPPEPWWEFSRRRKAAARHG